METVKTEYNRLLKRQIKKYLPESIKPESISEFLLAINESYEQHIQDRELLERSLDISSDEFMEANQELLARNKKQRAYLDKLNEVLAILGEIPGMIKLPDHETPEDVGNMLDELIGKTEKIAELENEKILIQRVINESNNGVVIFEEDGLVMFANKNAALWREMEFNSLIGKSMEEVDENCQCRNTQSWSQIQETLKGSENISFIVTAFFSGEEHFIERQIKKISLGGKIFFLEVSRDITEKIRAEKEQSHLIDRLKESNEELQNFAYIASHDLKAPLNNLQSLVSILVENTQLDENQESILNNIEKSVAKLKANITALNEVIAATKRLDLKREEVSFDEIVEDVLSNLSVSILEKRASLKRNYIDLKLFYPRIHLEHILQNLVSNALKYSKSDESPVIEFDLHLEDGTPVLKIKDNGIGMDLSKYGNKLFGLFQRFHKGKEEGKGIGLHVIKNIVEKYGGTINAESEVGRGSTFIVNFGAESAPVMAN